MDAAKIPLRRAYSNLHKEHEDSIKVGITSLLWALQDLTSKGIELERLCRTSTLLFKSGLYIQNPSIFTEIYKRCLREQKEDGGFTDVECTAWCICFLKAYKENDTTVILQSAVRWLREQRHENGSWGRSKRDIGRLPITGILLYLLPELLSDKTISWMKSEWDLDRLHTPILTYKGSSILFALSSKKFRSKSEEKLISSIVDWLLSQQNDDGGWGPWKEHPIGSTPLYTSLSLIALLHHLNPIKSEVRLVDALIWLIQNQLPNGLWPEHYIEVGTAWATYSLVLSKRMLKTISER